MPSRLAALESTLRDRIRRRRGHVSLLRQVATDVAPALSAIENLDARPCPVCGDERPEPRPAVRGLVYAFHRCRGCSLLYTPRLLTPAAERKHFAKRPVSRAYWSHMYHDARAMKGRPVFDALVRRLLAAAPRRDCAIDVGCHFGKLVEELAPHFAETFGLELDAKTARVGREIFAVDIRTTRLEALDRPPATVDLITMNQLLEHLRDVRTVMSAAHRLLRPRGVLWIGIPHGASLGLRVRGGAHPAVATHQHLNLFTRGSLLRLAGATGFSVAAIGTDDAVDASAADWIVQRQDRADRAERRPLLAAPAFAFDRAVRGLASLSRLPSRLGVGAHLEALLVKEA